MAWLCLVSLFNGTSTFVSHLMPKPSLLKNSSGTSKCDSRPKQFYLDGVKLVIKKNDNDGLAWIGFFFNGISTLLGNLMPKPSF